MKVFCAAKTALLCLLFCLALPQINADSLDHSRFFFEWDSSFPGTPEEYEQVHSGLSIQHPDLTNLSDGAIAKKSEKDVEIVFKALAAAKAQYEKAQNPQEKFVAQKVLYNWTQLYRVYRILIPPPSARNDSQSPANTQLEDYRLYGNDIKPFRNFKIIRSEVTENGVVIEFEYTYDHLNFYSSTKGEESSALFHRPWALGGIFPDFFSNGVPEGYVGGRIRPDKSGARIKKSAEVIEKYFIKSTKQITNSYINSYAQKYAQAMNINWPPNYKDRFSVQTYTDKWVWKPIAKANYENRYLIKISDMLGNLLHEELITVKTGSDIKNSKVEIKTLFDSSAILWGLGGTFLALGLIGKFTGKKPKLHGGQSGSTSSAEPPQASLGPDSSHDSEELDDQDGKLLVKNQGRALVVLAGSEKKYELATEVIGSDAVSWTIEAEVNSSDIIVEKQVISSSKASFFFADSCAKPLNKNEPTRNYRISFTARAEAKTLTASADLVLGQEGLFINSNLPVKIMADADTLTPIKITSVIYDQGWLRTNSLALYELKLIFEAADNLSAKAFETSQVDFGSETSWENVRESIDAQNKSNLFANLVYKAKTRNALPSRRNETSEHNVHKGQLTIKSERTGREISVPIELLAPAEPAKSERFATEYQNCKLIINKYVPAQSGYQEKFNEMLEKWKQAWGPDGMYKFRNDIWGIAQKLWEIEGYQGYIEIGKRIETYDRLRNWTQWCGDLALTVVVYAKTGGGLGGTLKQTAISMLKQSLVSAVDHYKTTVELTGTFMADDCDKWVENQLQQQMFASPDQMITVASLTGYIKPGKATVLMFINVFLRSLIMSTDWQQIGANWDEENGKKAAGTDICRAAFIAAKESFKSAGTMVLTQWFTGVVIKSSIKQGVKVHDDVLKRYAKELLKARKIPLKPTEPYSADAMPKVVQKMIGNIKNGYAQAEDVLACLKDQKTQAMRTLKNAPVNVQQAFMKTLRKTYYKPHDRALIKHLKGQTKVPWAAKTVNGKLVETKFRIVETSTPGKKTIFSQDRDYCPQYFDSKTGQWLEVTPERHWKSTSKSWWNQNAKGFDPDQLQQAGMSRLGDEAAPDYATQRLNQHTGLQEVVTANIIDVANGKATLKSPIELAAMYKNKIEGPLKFGNMAECIAQTKKGVQLYDKVIKGYQKQNLRVSNPETQFKLAMEIISYAPDDFQATPDAINNLSNILKTETGFNNIAEFGRELVIRIGRL